MRRVVGYRCTICGKEFPFGPELMTCPSCGEKGILDILYDYDEIRKTLTKEKLKNCTDNSMWRYRDLMPVADDTDVSGFLRIGWTPLYESTSLRDELGIKKLYVKDDGLNPTASLKDRASGVAVAKAIELGYNTIACSSTGNAASSCAGSAARMGLKAVIFVPERAPEGKVAQLMIFGAKVVSVHGDYKATFDLSKAAIAKYGWYNRNAGINPVMTEGKKTVALEIAEQLNFEPTDWVACSVGDGCTIGGVYNGFYDLYKLGLIDRIPKILGVQSTGCCPFVDAANEGRDLVPTEENTIADSIAVGVPRNPRKALRAVRDSKGAWIAVTDEQILDTMRVLGRHEGVFGEPAGVTATAGVREAVARGIIKPDETVTAISTGSGLKDVRNALKAAGKPKLCEPDLDALEASGILG
ncbi:MAG: threonine synthase [Clostridia bacterium]|nr:threonine synthase [Clostridia bacterium]